MNDRQSLANQLGWCIGVTDHLNELIVSLAHVIREYDNSYDFLNSAGFLSEYLSAWGQMRDEFANSASDLMAHVENEHLTYITSQCELIRSTLQSQLSQ
ncbi:hypothetical protein [Oceanithermus sp.]